MGSCFEIVRLPKSARLQIFVYRFTMFCVDRGSPHLPAEHDLESLSIGNTLVVFETRTHRCHCRPRYLCQPSVLYPPKLSLVLYFFLEARLIPRPRFLWNLLTLYVWHTSSITCRLSTWILFFFRTGDYIRLGTRMYSPPAWREGTTVTDMFGSLTSFGATTIQAFLDGGGVIFLRYTQSTNVVDNLHPRSSSTISDGLDSNRTGTVHRVEVSRS